MRRVSYYISADVAVALDEAVEEVLIQGGGDVPKHQVLSALLAAGAGHIADVTAALAESRTAELAARLESPGNSRPGLTLRPLPGPIHKCGACTDINRQDSDVVAVGPAGQDVRDGRRPYDTRALSMP